MWAAQYSPQVNQVLQVIAPKREALHVEPDKKKAATKSLGNSKGKGEQGTAELGANIVFETNILIVFLKTEFSFS